MTHMIMEAEKMCNWQAGDPRKADVDSVQKPSRFENQEEPMLQFEGRKTNLRRFNAVRQEEFPLTPYRIRLSCSIQVFT